MRHEISDIFAQAMRDERLESISFEHLGYDMAEMASLEASIQNDIAALDLSVKSVRALEAINPTEMSVESYRAAMGAVLCMVGIEDTTHEVIASFESGTSVEDYSVEADDKKQAFVSRVWEAIKRMFASLKAKLMSWLGLNKDKIEKLEAQQKAVEKEAATVNNDFSKFSKKVEEEHPQPAAEPKPAPVPTLRLGYDEGHKLTLGFLGHTLAEVAASAGHVSDFVRKFLDEIASAADKAARLDHTTIRDLTGEKPDFPQLVTTYHDQLKLPSGTTMSAEFHYGGPKVVVSKGTAKTVEVRLHEVPLGQLVTGRRHLIAALAYKQAKLGHLKQVVDAMYPTFKRELEKRDELAATRKDPEWKENQPKWAKQEPIMRGIEAILGWMNGSIYSPVQNFIDPSIAEIDRCIGLRK